MIRDSGYLLPWKLCQKVWLVQKQHMKASLPSDTATQQGSPWHSGHPTWPSCDRLRAASHLPDGPKATMGPALMSPTRLPSLGQHSAPAARHALLGLHLTSATTALGTTLCAHHHANSRAAQAGGLYPGGQASTWNGVLRVKTDGWVRPTTLSHTDTDTWHGAAPPRTLPDVRAQRLGLGFLTAASLSGPCLRLPPRLLSPFLVGPNTPWIPSSTPLSTSLLARSPRTSHPVSPNVTCLWPSVQQAGHPSWGVVITYRVNSSGRKADRW